MADGATPEERVLVVLDVNIYLDVAQLVGEPFEWSRFEQLAVDHVGDDLPHRNNARVDSLRALSCLVAGRLPNGVPLELWTSDHIDLLVAHKAASPVRANREEDRGLGWSRENAQALVDDLVAEVIDRTNGGSAGEIEISYGTPPLSHEDGLVYATVNSAGYNDSFYERFCLTRDQGFLDAQLPGLIDTMHPASWVMKHRALSSIEAFRKLSGAG